MSFFLKRAMDAENSGWTEKNSNSGVESRTMKTVLVAKALSVIDLHRCESRKNLEVIREDS